MSASERLRALELLERLGDEEETLKQAISSAVAAMNPVALDFELDSILAGLIRDGEIERRFPELSSALNGEVERRINARRVKVHAPPPEPDPPAPPVKVDPGQVTLADAEPLASTYSREFYERLGVPVAAELDRPD